MHFFATYYKNNKNVSKRVFYVAQNKFAGTQVLSGFIHVPLMESQAPEFPGLPTMPLDQMVIAVRAMLEVL